MIGIVASRADPASTHIAEHLLDIADFERTGDDAHRTAEFELRTFDDLHLHLDGVGDAFDDPELLVFVSKHAGDTGALLTAHFTGNFGVAQHGGADRELATACPNAHSRVVAALDEHAPDDYEVGVECTHHGPTDVGVPSMFVELGSDEEQWQDPDGARAVAKAVLDLASVDAGTERTLAAFGGGHYAPRSTRIVRETDWAVGHIAADWCLDDLGIPGEHLDVLEQVFEASGATRAVVEGDKPDLDAAIESLGYDVVSETWVRAVSGVPVPLATALESDLRPVDDGLRFGAPAEANPTATDHDGLNYVVVVLPDAVVNAAHAVDEQATVDAALATALAAETAENGNRLGTRAAFEEADAYESFVTRLAAVLERDYDVIWDNDRLTAQRDAFDPEAAADRGVPEGPAFGRLANGDPVDVDGETIHPVDVSRTETITASVGFRERPRERVRRPSDAEGKGN